MSGPRGWVSDLALGVRLAVGGGRTSLARFALSAVGIAVAVAVLLVAASVGSMVEGYQARAWANTIGENRPVAGVDPVYMQWGATEYRGQNIDAEYVYASGPNHPVPHGMPRLPGPGELVVSPGLAELLASPEGELLRPRFPGRIVGVLDASVVPEPGELAAFVGADAGLMDNDNALAVYSFGGEGGRYVLAPEVLLLLLIGSVVVLLPVFIFVASASRIAGGDRDRRLSALRLVGSGSWQVRRIAAAESLVSSLAGLVLGGAGFLILRRYAEDVVLFDMRVYVEDVVPDPVLVALIVLTVPALGVLTGAVRAPPHDHRAARRGALREAGAAAAVVAGGAGRGRGRAAARRGRPRPGHAVVGRRHRRGHRAAAGRGAGTAAVAGGAGRGADQRRPVVLAARDPQAAAGQRHVGARGRRRRGRAGRHDHAAGDRAVGRGRPGRTARRGRRRSDGRGVGERGDHRRRGRRPRGPAVGAGHAGHALRRRVRERRGDRAELRHHRAGLRRDHRADPDPRLCRRHGVGGRHRQRAGAEGGPAAVLPAVQGHRRRPRGAELHHGRHLDGPGRPVAGVDPAGPGLLPVVAGHARRAARCRASSRERDRERLGGRHQPGRRGAAAQRDRRPRPGGVRDRAWHPAGRFDGAADVRRRAQLALRRLDRHAAAGRGEPAGAGARAHPRAAQAAGRAGGQRRAAGRARPLAAVAGGAADRARHAGRDRHRGGPRRPDPAADPGPDVGDWVGVGLLSAAAAVLSLLVTAMTLPFLRSATRLASLRTE